MFSLKKNDWNEVQLKYSPHWGHKADSSPIQFKKLCSHNWRTWFWIVLRKMLHLQSKTTARFFARGCWPLRLNTGMFNWSYCTVLCFCQNEPHSYDVRCSPIHWGRLEVGPLWMLEVGWRQRKRHVFPSRMPCITFRVLTPFSELAKADVGFSSNQDHDNSALTKK